MTAPLTRTPEEGTAAPVAHAPGRPGSPTAWAGSSMLGQVRVLTGRSLRAMATDPGTVLFGLIQPVIILFVLTQVFSKMGHPPHFPKGVSYLDFVLPAVLIDNAVQSAMQSGVGLVDDLKNGIVARLRSLPIHPSSLLIARSISSLVRSAIQVVIILLLGITVLGYSPKGGAGELAASAGLTLFISWTLGWAFIAAGAWLRRAEPMQNLAIIAIFPLMFASSAYVPVDDLPAWLRVVAEVNPLTYAIDATRALALDVPGADAALPAVLISGFIAVVGAVAAVLGFRRPL
ncbi:MULTISPECIES: ABC transporter permease [Streptomyces]|uniref:Transport permease protein n=3 Tax=Streptomyces TaxID=1883 RepID=A0A3Q9FU34_STRLT|nr:ABC transporter permease [Streptomyces luteoverticillatus]AZQ70188.1 ABC transporter permease [Streptomyces luteoverticillatus]